MKKATSCSNFSCSLKAKPGCLSSSQLTLNAIAWSPFQDKASLLRSVYIATDSCVHTALRPIQLHNMAALARAQCPAVFLGVKLLVTTAHFELVFRLRTQQLHSVHFT